MRAPKNPAITTFQVGDIRIDRIVEMEIPFRTVEESYAGVDREAFEAVRSDFEPWGLEPGSEKLVLAIQSYLIRTRRHTILVDTCVGCGKSNDFFPDWHQRDDTGWLRRLAAAGVSPEAVDFVLCTHLHSDHCGWNTQLLNGRWVPTFANATYVMAGDEVAPMVEAEGGSYAHTTYAESVLPVIEAGQAALVTTSHALDDEVWLEPTPGHTRGHVAVRLRSKGHEAVLCGDLIHSPLQCLFADWRYRIDWDSEMGVATRRRFLDEAAETGRPVLTAHFPSPSMGYVRTDGTAWTFEFLR